MNLLELIPVGIVSSIFSGGVVWGTFKLTLKSNTKELANLKEIIIDPNTKELRFMSVERCKSDKGEILQAIKNLDDKQEKRSEKLLDILSGKINNLQ